MDTLFLKPITLNAFTKPQIPRKWNIDPIIQRNNQAMLAQQVVKSQDTSIQSAVTTQQPIKNVIFTTGPASGRMYIGSLLYTITKDTITDVFKSFGQITHIEMPPGATPNSSKGYCFITFAHPNSVADAMSIMPHFSFFGRPIKVKLPKDEEILPSWDSVAHSRLPHVQAAFRQSLVTAVSFGLYTGNIESNPGLVSNTSHNNTISSSSSSSSSSTGQGLSSSTINKTWRLFVGGGVHYDVTEDQIRQLFGTCGEIVDINFNIDPNTGKHRGFIFVTYKELDSALQAIAILNGQDLLGRKLTIKFAKGCDPPPGTVIPTPLTHTAQQYQTGLSSQQALKDIPQAPYRVNFSSVYIPDPLQYIYPHIQASGSIGYRILSQRAANILPSSSSSSGHLVLSPEERMILDPAHAGPPSQTLIVTGFATPEEYPTLDIPSLQDDFRNECSIWTTSVVSVIIECIPIHSQCEKSLQPQIPQNPNTNTNTTYTHDNISILYKNSIHTPLNIDDINSKLHQLILRQMNGSTNSSSNTASSSTAQQLLLQDKTSISSDGDGPTSSSNSSTANHNIQKQQQNEQQCIPTILSTSPSASTTTGAASYVRAVIYFKTLPEAKTALTRLNNRLFDSKRLIARYMTSYEM